MFSFQVWSSCDSGWRGCDGLSGGDAPRSGSRLTRIIPRTHPGRLTPQDTFIAQYTAHATKVTISPQLDLIVLWKPHRPMADCAQTAKVTPTELTQAKKCCVKLKKKRVLEWRKVRRLFYLSLEGGETWSFPDPGGVPSPQVVFSGCVCLFARKITQKKGQPRSCWYTSTRRKTAHFS